MSEPELHSSVLPFGMQEAPSAPITKAIIVDLAQYLPEYAGWCIAIDPSVPMDIDEYTDTVRDPNTSGKEKKLAMQAWLEACLVGWNFVTSTLQPDGTWVTVPMPQPRDGGVQKISSKLLAPIAKAVSDFLRADLTTDNA